MHRTALALTCLTFAALVTGTAEAKTVAQRPERPDRPGAPYFVVHGGDDAKGTEKLPLRETRAAVKVAGSIAHVRVTQVYENDGTSPIEAIYVFPGSTKSAVFGMKMTIGARTIEAKIAKKEAARQLYEKAKQQGKSASLLEQQRPNVFTMNVANIMPGDRIEVVLDYTELIVPTDGTYEWVYPTVVGPRFHGGAASGEDNDAKWVSNPYTGEGQGPTYDWGLTVDIDAGMGIRAVRSPTHPVTPSFLSESKAHIEVNDAKGGNRDFVLRYRLSGNKVETGLMLFPGEKENFFLMMMEPPERVTNRQMPPREYIFIVDVSGSMNGFPIKVTKALMKELFRGMRAQDKFNVMLFAGGSRVLAPKSLRATRANIDKAMRTLDRERGGGSTQLLPAMRRALALPRSDEMSTSMVIVTDGYVTVEREALELVANNLGEANLFAFGIGSSVNRHLVEALARAGMGEPFVVTHMGEAEDKATKFKNYIGAPALTNIKVGFNGFDAYDVEPRAVPDLFAQRPVVVFGKYKGAPGGKITVTGRSARGAFEKTMDVGAFSANSDNVALQYLWARHRIQRLSDYAATTRRNGKAELAEAITSLGLQYNLLTQHTSFVAVDSEIRNVGGKSEQVQQPLPLPQGVSQHAVGQAGGLAGLSITGGGAGGGGFGSGALGGRGRVGTPRRSMRARHKPMTRRPRAADAPAAAESADATGSYPEAKVEQEIRSTKLSASTPIVRGSLDASVVRRVFRANHKRFQRVFHQALKRNPRLGGKIVFRLEIGADGKVAKVAIVSSELGDPKLVAGLRKVMKSLRFPKPAGGGTVVISYPLTLRAK